MKVRYRHDGWTPERQGAFIDALAECGCVSEAAARVGMSATAAYALRRQVDAQSFRFAWDAALDHAVSRLADAAFSRALNGVARPVFFRGEQVGERRYYDERLTMFILRMRAGDKYGAWIDKMMHKRGSDGPALMLAKCKDALAEDEHDLALGIPRRRRPRPKFVEVLTPEEEEERKDALVEAREKADRADYERRLDAFIAGTGPDPDGDDEGTVVTSSTTSADPPQPSSR